MPYKTSDVASLTRLSLSIVASTCRGIATRSVIGANATSSVDETIAPSTNAVAHAIVGISACATALTANIVMTTSPNASWKIHHNPDDVKNSLVGAVTASQYSSGGRKITRTRSGGIASAGSPGM